MTNGGASARQSQSQLPLFRPEALAEPEYGEAFAFSVPRWSTLGVLAASALFLFLAFGFVASFDRVATAPGVVMPVSGVSRILATRPGVVAAVFVREGSRVSRGQPLLRIEAYAGLPGGASFGQERLEAYRHQLVADRERQRSEEERRSAERLQVQNEAVELQSALAAVRAQVALQEQRTANAERRLNQLGLLRPKGYVSEFSYLAQQETLLSLRQQLTELRQRVTETAHKLERTKLRLAELDADARRGELASLAGRLGLERAAAEAQIQSEVTLVAPAGGVLGTMRAAPGKSVAAGEELAAIVPADGRLEAMLFVAPASAGSLRPGHPVTLRFDPFPYQRHGVGHGIVTALAATAVAERPGAAPTYRVKVRLLDAGRFALRPDMTLAANIIVEKRSLLDWLLAPLRETAREQQRAAAS